MFDQHVLVHTMQRRHFEGSFLAQRPFLSSLSISVLHAVADTEERFVWIVAKLEPFAVIL